jgi:hypothetical protein
MAGWVLLVYRVPPEPTAPRVAIWRALKRLPGGYLQDGAFTALASDETELQLGILAHDIRNLGGEATVLHVDRVDDERHLKQRLAASASQPSGKRPAKGARRSK